MVQHANLEGKESTSHKHLLVLYLHRHNEQTHIPTSLPMQQSNVQVGFLCQRFLSA